MNSLRVHELEATIRARPGTVLLDVREPWETALAAIELAGAHTLRLPLSRLTTAIDDIPRSQPVVCICHHGVRSAQVVAFLLRAGWSDVYNLEGGVDAWSCQVDPAVPHY